MNDYMKAIYQRFYTVSEEERTLDCQVDEIRRELSETMDKEKRRKLLLLTDLEDALRSLCGLRSFMEGFRIANGIQHELMMQPPYSFVADEESRAIAMLKKENKKRYENSAN